MINARRAVTAATGSTLGEEHSVSDSVPKTAEEYRKWWAENYPDTPFGFCACGCGVKTAKAVKSHTKRALVAGQPVRYRSGHNGRFTGPEYIEDSETGCWIWQHGRDSYGYGRKMCEGRTYAAYILIYERHVGPVPARHELHHRCVEEGYGSILCVRPSHLEPLTIRDHARRGEWVKLDLTKVRFIREVCANKTVSQTNLAKRFGVSNATISNIVHNKTWKDV